MLATDQTA